MDLINVLHFTSFARLRFDDHPDSGAFILCEKNGSLSSRTGVVRYNH